MERARAERYRPLFLCPLCEFISSNYSEVIDHLVDNHSDEEATEQLGWL